MPHAPNHEQPIAMTVHCVIARTVTSLPAHLSARHWGNDPVGLGFEQFNDLRRAGYARGDLSFG